MITNVIASPLKNKKYRAIFSDGSKIGDRRQSSPPGDRRQSSPPGDRPRLRAIDFGLDGSSTYLDHHDKTKRDNYRARHYANEREKYLIDNRIPSPALLSFYLLWGPHTSLSRNVDYLNTLL